MVVNNNNNPCPALSTTPPLRASDHFHDPKHHLLLAATGSVATIKIPQILHSLSRHHETLTIRLLLTTSASTFLQSQSPEQPSLAHLLTTTPNLEAIHLDADEWRKPWVRGDPILHIELRKWADMMVIAPLSANSMAKMALGLSDDLVSSVLRAWDATGMVDEPRGMTRREFGEKKVVVVAPAMNTAMWAHPVTGRHLTVLEEEWGVGSGGWVEVLRPIEKELACGDTGSGAMCEWTQIVMAIEARLGLAQNGQA